MRKVGPTRVGMLAGNSPVVMIELCAFILPY
jgi:hypothetical protein